MYKRNNEGRSRNHCCRAKAISITYSELGSAGLVFQHAKHVILSSVARPTLQFFSTLSHKWQL